MERCYRRKLHLFYMCQFAIKSMIKNKSGSIINITSVVGHTGNTGQVTIQLHWHYSYDQVIS